MAENNADLAQTTKLAPFQLKQLLIDQETAVLRHKKGFGAVYDARKNFYGDSKSALRKVFGKQRDLFNHRAIKSYIVLLHDHGVKPHTRTVQEAKKAGILTDSLKQQLKDLGVAAEDLDSSNKADDEGLADEDFELVDEDDEEEEDEEEEESLDNCLGDLAQLRLAEEEDQNEGDALASEVSC
jgi:hypothetical protein